MSDIQISDLPFATPNASSSFAFDDDSRNTYRTDLSEMVSGMMESPSIVSAFSSGLTVTLSSSEAKARSIQDTFLDKVSVMDFIPAHERAGLRAGTSSYDCTAAFNNAILHVDSTSSGGTVYVPSGTYNVTSVNATKSTAVFSKTLRILGEGRRATIIRGSSNGKIIIEATGRNFFEIGHLTVSTAPGVTAQAGVLLARHQGSQNCNNNGFYYFNVEGAFSKAAFVSLASESNRWDSCRFENRAGSGLRRCFYTSPKNDGNISLTDLTYEPYESSNTDNRMVNCEFYMVQNGDNELFAFNRNASYNLLGCLFVTGTRTGTIKLASFMIHEGGGNQFSGFVQFVDCHFEGGGAGIVPIYFNCGGAQKVFHCVSCIRGNMVMHSGAHRLIDYDRENGGQAYLGHFLFEPPRLTTNLAIHVYGFRYSTVNAFCGNGFEITVIVSGIILRSKVRANILKTAQQVEAHSEFYSDGLPTSGTFGVADRIINSSPAIGEPAFWVCSVAGTVGTLSGITASGTAGQTDTVFNSTTGLSEGDYVSFVGFSGARKIVKINGTTVTILPSVGLTISNAAVQFFAPTFLAAQNMTST